MVNPDSPEAWSIEIRPGSISLGRGEENDFQLDHPSISSTHCRIVVSGAAALLKDLGSTSGTFIDGQLVEEARLRPGQVFCLGEVRLRFEADPPAVAEAGLAPTPRPPGARLSGSTRSEAAPSNKPSFVASLGAAFLYPLRKGGVLLLAGGTAFFSVVEAGKFFARFAAVKGIGLGAAISSAFLLLFTLFGLAYLASYLRRVVIRTAMGEQAAPDWPEITDFRDEILSPLYQLTVTIVASLAPAIVVGMLIHGTEKWGPPAIWAAGSLGVVYFPMAFLAVAMFDSAAAVNPLLVVPSILKILGSYLLVVVLFGAVLAAKFAGAYFLPQVIPLPIVPSVISTFVGLYLLTAEARMLGLLYSVHQDQLGWFGHR